MFWEMEYLANGREKFERYCVEKLLAEHKVKIFLNECPKCMRLARTPFAI